MRNTKRTASLHINHGSGPARSSLGRSRSVRLAQQAPAPGGGAPAGGSADSLARLLAEGLQQELRKPVIVETKPAPAACWQSAISRPTERTDIPFS